ncbi:hypothetical protein D3C76_53770 [compost metagenome]
MFSYQEWSEPEGRVLSVLQEKRVPGEEIFLRKLVNATVIRNQVYEHTSNESEVGERHNVYVKPFDEDDLELYGVHIKSSLFENSARSIRIETEFLCWEETGFERREVLAPIRDLYEISQLLLDHHLVIRGNHYEILYSVLDTDMNKVNFYLKEMGLS